MAQSTVGIGQPQKSSRVAAFPLQSGIVLHKLHALQDMYHLLFRFCDHDMMVDNVGYYQALGACRSLQQMLEMSLEDVIHLYNAPSTMFPPFEQHCAMADIISNYISDLDEAESRHSSLLLRRGKALADLLMPLLQDTCTRLMHPSVTEMILEHLEAEPTGGKTGTASDVKRYNHWIKEHFALMDLELLRQQLLDWFQIPASMARRPQTTLVRRWDELRQSLRDITGLHHMPQRMGSEEYIRTAARLQGGLMGLSSQLSMAQKYHATPTPQHARLVYGLVSQTMEEVVALCFAGQYVMQIQGANRDAEAGGAWLQMVAHIHKAALQVMREHYNAVVANAAHASAGEATKDKLH